MSDEATVLAEAARLPIDERCTHANWKVRSAAYEHIRASCGAVFDASDPVLAEFGEPGPRSSDPSAQRRPQSPRCCSLLLLPLLSLTSLLDVALLAAPQSAPVFGKATADGNAAALDKALEALAAWLDKASDAAAGRVASNTCANIVAKALGARAATAAKGVDALVAFVEAEQADKATVRRVLWGGRRWPAAGWQHVDGARGAAAAGVAIAAERQQQLQGGGSSSGGRQQQGRHACS